MIPICFTSTPLPILGDRKFLTFLKNIFFHYTSYVYHPAVSGGELFGSVSGDSFKAGVLVGSICIYLDVEAKHNCCISSKG